MRRKPEKCECGCGAKTVRRVRLLPAHLAGTAAALNWAAMSVDPMRDEIPLVRGHEPDGYLMPEDEGDCR